MKLVLRKILPDGQLADSDVFEFSVHEVEKNLNRLEVPQEVVHKALFSPSYKIRAKAVTKEIKDVALIQKYISQETCRSNLALLARSENLERLPLKTMIELFNKCPDAVREAYYGNEEVPDACDISLALEDPFARYFMKLLSLPVEKRQEEEYQLWKASFNGEPIPLDAYDLRYALYDNSNEDLDQNNNVIEAMVQHPDPEIREDVVDLADEFFQIRELALDPYFSIRKRVIRTELFAEAHFSVDELLNIISDDPELAKLVIEKHQNHILILELCEQLAESTNLEIRAMAIRQISIWHLIKHLEQESDEMEVDEDEDDLDEIDDLNYSVE